MADLGKQGRDIGQRQLPAEKLTLLKLAQQGNSGPMRERETSFSERPPVVEVPSVSTRPDKSKTKPVLSPSRSEMGDKDQLLTSAEIAMKNANEASKGLYFDDGIRRIDLVLAYQVDPKQETKERERLGNIRMTFLQHAVENGLEIEECGAIQDKEEYGTFSNDKQDPQMRYVKVHGPFEALCDTAEKMNMKMPILENDISIPSWFEELSPSLDKAMSRLDPFVLRDPQITPTKSYFVARFVKDRLGEFINWDSPDAFFSIAERGRLVYYILEQSKFGPGQLDIGVSNLIHTGAFLDCYALHDGPILENARDKPVNSRQALQADWASARRIFKYQPIPGIKEYFGEKVALYFAWLGFYTSFLVPAAIVGFACFLYGIGSAFNFVPVKETCAPNDFTFYMCPLCDKLCSFYLLSAEACLYAKATHFFDNEGTLFFALFMSLWATVFLEFWKRKQISLAHEWHSMDFEEEEELPRPEYLATVTTYKFDYVTRTNVQRMSFRQKSVRLTGAFGVVLFFVGLVLAAVTSVIVFRAAFYVVLIGSNNTSIRQRSKLIVSAVAAVINLIAINILKLIYKMIAVKITDWENPRTLTDYEDSFTMKMFWFQFVNTYASIFYVAFFKSEFFTGFPGSYKRFTGKQFRFDGCSVQGCFLELTIQLIIIMVGQQIFGNVMEIVVPLLKKKYQDYKDKGLENTQEPQWEDDFECQMQDKFSLFWQYLEIVLQYGFVTMFVAAFPLAPFFALCNNLAEIRLDAINFVTNFRRPVAARAEDIGAWYGILVTLTGMSVFVNAFVLAFTSDLIPRLTYKYYKSPDHSLAGYLNWSMSYFDVSQFDANTRPDNPTLNVNRTMGYCRYPGFHEPFETDYNKDYWVVLSARLAFVFVFQVFVVVVTTVIAWLIPDMPKALELKIKRENYLAGEAMKKGKKRGASKAASTGVPSDEKPAGHKPAATYRKLPEV